MLDRLGRLLLAGSPPVHGHDRRPATRAVLAFALAGFLLATAASWVLPAFAGDDEVAHLGDVAEVSEGRVPHIDTAAPEDGPFPAIERFYEVEHGAGGAEAAGNRGDVWVANHPPLAAAVVAPVARLAALTPWDQAPLRAVRAVNALAFAFRAVAVAAVVDGLLPGRPRVAVVASALAALAPNVLGIAALAHPDGVAFLVATALLAAMLRVLRSGPSWPRLIGSTLLAGGAALSRASLLPLVVLAAGAWLGRCLGVAEDRRWTGWGALMVVIPAAMAGWFYVRNVDLYGDVAASGYLQRRFGRERNGSTLEVLGDPGFLPGIWQGLWGSVSRYATVGSGRRLTGQAGARLGTSLIPGLVVLVAAVPGWWATGRRLLTRTRPRVARRTLACWGLALIWFATTIVGTASFVAGGGTPHPRYVLPAFGVVATVLAVGLVQPAWRGRSIAVLIVGALVAFDLVLLSRVGRTPLLDEGTAFAGAFAPPGWAVVLVGVSIVGAIAAAVAGLRTLAHLPLDAVTAPPYHHGRGAERGLTTDDV